MILPLRRAHRLFAVLLALLLPILVLIALVMRPAPLTSEWPHTPSAGSAGAER